jgi:hypothetical protein
LSKEFRDLREKPGALTKLSKDEQTQMEAAEVENIARMKQSLLVNDGTQESHAKNPYMANFAMLEVVSKMPAISQANPIVGSVVNSKLYKSIRDKNSTNSNDKRAVSDEEVITAAAELIAKKELSPAEAAKQTVDYFSAAVVTNNATEQFAKFGLPEQESYVVPVRNGGRKTGFIAAQTKVDKAGKVVNDFVPFDLTSEAKVRALLLTRVNNPNYYSNSLMQGLANFATGAIVTQDENGNMQLENSK